MNFKTAAPKTENLEVRGLSPEALRASAYPGEIGSKNQESQESEVNRNRYGLD